MKSVIGRLLAGLKTTIWGGISLLWLAPIIPLIAILPEFAQHVAEVQLGMFESEEAFAAQAMSAERWLFAYFKIAGLFIAILAAARYWGGARKLWWDLRGVAWKQLLIALALNIAVTAIGLAIAHAFDHDVPVAINILYQIAILPLLIYFFGPLIGDRTMTLRRAYTYGWFAALLAGAYALVTFGPAQLLHQYNHDLALGQGEVIVWMLMVFDSVLVGLMACWLGTALAAGYWLGLVPGGDSADGQPAQGRT